MNIIKNKVKSIFISDKQYFNLDKTYDEYAKKVLERKEYPLGAVYKADLLYKFSMPFIKNISSIADIGGSYGYCLNRFYELYREKKHEEIELSVYELGKEYLILGHKIFPQINFFHSDKMGNKKYDVVLLCDVLEHIINYDDFLDKVKSTSQKYILVWSPLELIPLHKILIFLRLMPKKRWGKSHRYKHVNFWGPAETVKILKKHFKILNIGYSTGQFKKKDGKEKLPQDTHIILKIIYFMSKYIPDFLYDFFYINLIGGHIMILCEVRD